MPEIEELEEQNSIVYPRIEDLLEHAKNRFELVVVAAKRARQIINFQKRVGEGIGGVAPLRLEDISKKPLTVALEEIAEGKVEVRRLEEEE